jgi:hypothetical protein
MSGVEVIGAIGTVVDLLDRCYKFYEAVNGRSKIEVKLRQELKSLPQHETLLQNAVKIHEHRERKYMETSNEDEKVKLKDRSDRVATSLNNIRVCLEQLERSLKELLPDASSKRLQRTLKRLQMMAPSARQDAIFTNLGTIEREMDFIKDCQIQEHQLTALGPEVEEDVAFSCWPPRTPAQKQIVDSYNKNVIVTGNGNVIGNGSGNNNCGNTNTTNNFNGNKNVGTIIQLSGW